jgi:glycosyltransferase involved in cell wall biosynthesis
MNICLVSQFYPPDTGGGGIAAYVYYLAHGLKRLGHRVFVVSKMAVGSQRISEDGSLTIIRVSQWSPSYRASRVPFTGRHMRALRNLIYSFAVRRQLAKLSRSVRLDVVEYSDIEAEGFLHSDKAGIPYVVRLHTPYFALESYYAEGEFGFSTATLKRMEAKAIRHANAITCPSRTLTKLVSDQYRMPLGLIKYISNGIDTNVFCPAPTLSESSGPLVLYVGRLERLKGADTLMQAIPLIARKRPDVRFAFLGSDRRSQSGSSQKAEILSYLSERGLIDQVVFRDHAEQQVFLEYFRRATVCVVPSRFENCPYTLLEAMACGKPVVAADNSGMAEIIRHEENGLLFETANPEALAAQVLKLLESPRLCSTLGNAGREFAVKHYDADLIAARTEEVYLDVLRAVS